MSTLWIVVALVGGCLVGVYIGILGMCLFAMRHHSDERVAYMLRDRAEVASEVGNIPPQSAVLASK
jgi:hypothetical protein